MHLKKVGKYYHAGFRNTEGKTSYVTTKQTDKREAARVASESGIKDMETAARVGRLTREVVGKIMAGKRVTIAKALDAYRAWMEADSRAPKTIHNNLCNVSRWARDTGMENSPPASVHENHISKWINNADDDTKAATRRVTLASMRNFFSFCVSRGWSLTNPASTVRVSLKGLSHEQKEAAVREPFNKEEVHRLLEHYKKQGDLFWQFAVRCSYETGLRLGDICQLEWDCFNQHGKMKVWMDKTDQPIEHAVSRGLEELVTQIPVSSTKWLFPEQHKIINDLNRRALLSVQFKRTCERLGIKGRSFHCLRHTAATKADKASGKEELAAKLADALTTEQIRQLLGHANAKTTKTYLH